MNKQKEVILELFQRKVDTAIVSKTKEKGNGNKNTKEFIHLYTGVDKSERAKSGVSIIIHNRLKKSITQNLKLAL